MKIAFAASADTHETVIAPAFAGGDGEGPTLSPAAARWDEDTRGRVQAAMAAARFTAKPGSVLVLPGFSAEPALARLVLVGLGPQAEVSAAKVEKAVAGVVRRLLIGAGAQAVLRLDGVALDAEAAARAGLGARLGAYRFDAYRSKLPQDKKPSLEALHIVVDDVAAAEAAWVRYDAVADGVALARDLVSEPPNILHPEAFAQRLKELETLGVEVEVLGEAQMAELGMHSLLGVGRGSRRESQLVLMRWRGEGADETPTAFIGKGVTFDTGGISLKPGAGMDEMKGDMGGAAAVSGLMRAVAQRKAKAHVVGVVGLVENMPDGDAQRPGDIVTSMSGQTIEILNTDAEGRLVLADAVWYANDRFKPKLMVDLATLTGAMVIALAHEYAGLFANDEALAEQLISAGQAADEPVWRMPLGEAYDRMIDSKVADMKNIGGRMGGSITAAQFIKRFVKDTPWAHLDIAPTAWKGKSDDPREPVWATGWGVRILERFIADHHEA